MSGDWIAGVPGTGFLATAGLAAAAFLLVLAATSIARPIVRRLSDGRQPLPRALELAIIGWLDWALAAAVFVACFHAAGSGRAVLSEVRGFFLGQAIGVASLVPGGVGSSDAFWIARLPVAESETAAVLLAYRAIYYIAPWAVASLLLLARATHSAPRRRELARRIVGGLVGGGGVLIILSSASPAVHARLLTLERAVPLQLVEASHVTAALAGLLLMVLARGLVRGYHAAFRATLILLTLASIAAILKGLDWEEALILAGIAVAARSQAEIFDRPSRGDWIERPDLVLAFAALTIFLAFGTFSHHLSAGTFARWSHIGYRIEGGRFLRTAASMALAVSAATLYLMLRTPSAFRRLPEAEVDAALRRHAETGVGTNALMVATGDKEVLPTANGMCLYRTIGPYLMIFSDPSVRDPDRRGPFLEELTSAAAEMDRRPVFYQVSLDWIPVLHDRGYHFFKLGEEAHVDLEGISLDGHAGKMYRQVLRRAERDDATFRILEPDEIAPRLAEMKEVSSLWLREKHLAERQFSMGFFDPVYMCRFPCRRGRGRRPRGADHGLRQPARRAAARGAVGRSDAAALRRSASDGLRDRVAAARGQAPRLPDLQPRHGAAGLGGHRAGGASPRAAGAAALPARRAVVQLPGIALLQGEVPAAVGAPLSGVPERRGVAGRECQRQCADCRRLVQDPPVLERCAPAPRRAGFEHHAAEPDGGRRRRHARCQTNNFVVLFGRSRGGSAAPRCSSSPRCRRRARTSRRRATRSTARWCSTGAP